MAPEPLHVDPEALRVAANGLLSAAKDIPAPPEPFNATGSDPLSQALAARIKAVEAPLIEGLPTTKADATQTAENVAKAAKAYEDTDRRLGDDIKRRTFPDPERNGQVRAAGFGTWKQEPPPVPVDPKNMTEAQARAAWTAVNDDIAQYSARCGRTFVLPSEGAAYNACVADRGPLLDR